MEIVNLVPDVLVGFLIGIAIGMTGIGGGALIQPALIHILGIAPVPAVGTGLLYAMLAKIWGTWSHYRLKTIRVRRAFYFLVGSVPSVLVASSIVNYFFQSFDSPRLNANIQIIMAISLLISATVLLVRTLPSNGKSEDVGMARTYLEGDRSPLPQRKKVIAIVAGVTIGALIGATSIGGGVLIIPVLMLFLDANPSQAVGTSIAISVVLSALGSIAYLLNGNIVVLTVALMALGAFPGVLIGSRLAVKLPESVLKIIVIVMVAGSGISLLFGIGH